MRHDFRRRFEQDQFDRLDLQWYYNPNVAPVASSNTFRDRSYNLFGRAGVHHLSGPVFSLFYVFFLSQAGGASSR